LVEDHRFFIPLLSDTLVGMTPLEFHQDLWHQNNEFLWANMRRCLHRYDLFSHFNNTSV